MSELNLSENPLGLAGAKAVAQVRGATCNSDMLRGTPAALKVTPALVCVCTPSTRSRLRVGVPKSGDLQPAVLLD